RGGCDDEIGGADPRMTPPNGPAKVAGFASHRLVDRDPGDRREQTLGRPPLATADAAHHLDPGDLRTAWACRQAGCVRDSGGMPAQHVDDDRCIPEDGHRRRRPRSSSPSPSVARTASTYDPPSGRPTGDVAIAPTAARNAPT